MKAAAISGFLERGFVLSATVFPGNAQESAARDVVLGLATGNPIIAGAGMWCLCWGAWARALGNRAAEVTGGAAERPPVSEAKGTVLEFKRYWEPSRRARAELLRLGMGTS